MDLNEIAIFVKVVQAGSFTKAALQLGMPNSTVSAKISSLEKRLGVTLIQRTTRKLHVTPAGDAYFKISIQALETLRSAEASALETRAEPKGLFRITAPVDLGGQILPDLVSAYTKKYPGVSVEIVLTDRRVDLLAEGMDLAIRAGELRDSTLIAKKIGSANFSLVAAPRYLKANGALKHPRDLEQHEFIRFRPIADTEIELSNARTAVKAQVRGRVILNDLSTAKSLAVRGGGIAILPTYFCLPELTNGRLELLLPDWHASASPVHFVYPPQKFVPAKVSSFIELAMVPLRKSLEDAPR